MKKQYQEPKLEVIELSNEDIIVTSQYDPQGLFNDNNTVPWNWS